MELPIGQRIKALRKALGLTQSELAAAAGVSEAAVSKWESGRSYPDITLLPDIARRLCTTVDHLLDFSAKLTDQELDRILEECSAGFEESFEKGRELCESHLSRHPGDAALKLYIGSLLPMHAGGLPPEQAARTREEAAELCRPASQGTDPKLRTAALRMLSSIHLTSGRLTEAEECLRESLCDIDGGTDPTLAVILQKKGETEKAREMYQRCLFRGVHGCQTALTGMAGLARAGGDEAGFLRYENAALELCRLFSLERLPDLRMNACLSLLNFCLEKRMPGELTDALEGFVDCAEHWNGEADLRGHGYFDRLTLHGGVFGGGRAMREGFSQIAAQLRDCDFIPEGGRFRSLLDRLTACAAGQ